MLILSRDFKNRTVHLDDLATVRLLDTLVPLPRPRHDPRPPDPLAPRPKAYLEIYLADSAATSIVKLRPGDVHQIGPVALHLLKIHKGGRTVRLGFEAPRSVHIRRGEHNPPAAGPSPIGDAVAETKGFIAGMKATAEGHAAADHSRPWIDIYLGCPYTHPDPDVRRRRFEAATDAAAYLTQKGLVVFSPITYTHPITERHDLPVEFHHWAAFDRAFLLNSQTLWVLTLPGWNLSVGLSAEIDLAHEHDKPIQYLDPADIPQHQ